MKREKVSFLMRRPLSTVAGAGWGGPDSMHNNKGLESFARDAGPTLGKSLSSLFFVPVGLTALFVLAASLLVGLI